MQQNSIEGKYVDEYPAVNVVSLWFSVFRRNIWKTKCKKGVSTKK